MVSIFSLQHGLINACCNSLAFTNNHSYLPHRSVDWAPAFHFESSGFEPRSGVLPFYLTPSRSGSSGEIVGTSTENVSTRCDILEHVEYNCHPSQSTLPSSRYRMPLRGCGCSWVQTQPVPELQQEPLSMLLSTGWFYQTDTSFPNELIARLAGPVVNALSFSLRSVFHTRRRHTKSNRCFVVVVFVFRLFCFLMCVCVWFFVLFCLGACFGALLLLFGGVVVVFLRLPPFLPTVNHRNASTCERS